jgi:hypothetical protein
MSNHPASTSASMAEALATVRASIRKAETNPSREPYCDAAAVLARFVPERLRPFTPTGSVVDGRWDDFVLDCEPVSLGGSPGWWRLKTAERRAALRRLRSRDMMRAALDTNRDRPDDLLQRALDRLIRGPETWSAETLEQMSGEDLAALATATEWMAGIISDLPSPKLIARALPRATLLAPMRRLAGRTFVGRESELSQLRDYVGILPAWGLVRTALRFVRKAYYDLTEAWASHRFCRDSSLTTWTAWRQMKRCGSCILT